MTSHKPSLSIWAGILVCLWGVGPVEAADFAVRAYLDQPQVAIGQQFTLSVELSGADADEAADPELPSLAAFADYLGSGSSSSIQIVNGRMSSSKTLNFYYRATHEGRFQVGPVTVTAGGETRATEPIPLEVVAGRAGPTPQSNRQSGQLREDDLFIRATASQSKVYVNEAILVTYKLYTRVNISGYNVAEAPDRSGFWVEDLLKGQGDVPTSVEVVNGIRYTVATLQKLALFPTAAGTKTLQPLVLECEVRLRGSARSIFDDPFFDPFGHSARFTVRSQPLEIEVSPLPQAGRPADFQGAVGRFELTAQLDKREASVNDVVTLKVELKGSGNLRALPAPAVTFSPGLESYAPKVSEKISASDGTVSGSRSYEYVLVPRSPGRQEVEAIRYPYFDPSRGRYEVAHLDPLEIAVSGPSALPAAAPASGREASRQNVRLLAQEIRFIKLSPGAFENLETAFYLRPLFWLLCLLPPLTLPGAFLYRRHADRLSGDQAYARDRRARRLAQQRLAGARALLQPEKHREFFAECGKALRGYAADKLNLSAAGLVSEQLDTLFRERGVPEAVLTSYLERIGECDRKQFAPVEASLEEMQRFLTAAEEAILTLHGELQT